MPERDAFSYNTVIAGLMKFGDVDGAKGVFDRMRCKDVVTWNSMISGYFQNGFMDEALAVFGMMPFKDVISWNLVISGLVDMREIGLAEEFFKEMSERDVVSWTLMMSGFLSVGRIVEARKCFDCMPMKDVQAWNTIISGYIKEGHVHIAHVLFHKMPERDWYSWNEMINGLLTNQLINDAMSLFRQMPQKCQRVWNSIVLAILRSGLINECHAVIEKSPYQNVVSHTNLIIGYFSIGEVVNAVKVFNLMPTLDTTVCNVMIYGLGESDHGEDGMKLFIRTKKGNLSLDESSYTSVLTICSNLPSLDLGKQTHAQVIKSGINCFTPVSNALVTMYARCGDLDFALLEFFSMSKHDIISWNSIICGLAYHGYGEKALNMFKQMTLTNIIPNQITFVGVLSACSHTGLVKEGKYYFDIMRYEYLIKPTSEHYTCIIDLFSRFGVIDEAAGILKKMIADGIEVPASVWGSMLGACRLHKEYELGKMVGEKMLELEPSNSGAYMILTEMHLHSENKDKAADILVRMRDKGIKKQPGCSWIEVNGSGNAFVAGENSHPDFPSICLLLNLMRMAMDIG
ncbi:hypothetical protein CTI12_AA620320 [Artemisia annua]|uniref:Pentatricopeptide repeat-containing protein n=1 Tax=Artemisia annua TaxID=35608 RepID=A0A2U1KC44_ARTAN|nr:hypothetical protein CTI12_AA620320 [Artemisia annua]